MSKKPKPTNWPRPVIQWGVIFAILVIALIPRFNTNFIPDFEAYCPFGGIQALGSYLLNQALSCTMTSAQIAMGIIMILAVFVFSKLFCAYICPVGTISEWLFKLGDKLNVNITIKGVADKALRSLKYILLFITVFFTFKSNELFCKKFDPYYAITTGFSIDVVVLYASIAIVLVILGSVFIRLFWCKYICPLGAISNIFKYTGFFLLVLVGYVLLLKLGLNIHYAWPLAIACIGGYAIELTGFATKTFPLLKITRNENSCIDCQLCSLKCPQAIDVASMKVVREADCNLCVECISVCPVKDTLQINNKPSFRWIPAIATVVLVVAGIFIGSLWELPTIDQQWYGKEVMAKAEIFTQSGLKNVKCYGSSMAFAAKMRPVNGVLGVATYVKTHKVKIYFDPQKLTSTKIQEMLFTPSKAILKPLKQGVEEVKEVTVYLDNFFDPFDFSYLTRLLMDRTAAVGLVTEYACPVLVKIYLPGDYDISESELISVLESKTLSFMVAEQEKTVELGYKVNKAPVFKTISKDEYSNILFRPYIVQFNGFTKYDSSAVKTLKFPMGKNKENRAKLNYLVSHLSNNRGIIEFRTLLNEKNEELVAVSYVDSLTNAQTVFQTLNNDTLIFNNRDGSKGRMENTFKFEE
ncbi:MAG: 4Fe-4S binding protein [Bacteroidia bacterium]|nr:4Fe-4S binding protein [Bacteroidia bacterium]